MGLLPPVANVDTHMTLVEMEDRLRVNAERRFADDCNAFEALLRVTLESLKEIQEIETAWRDAIARNEMLFNPEFDGVLFERYRAAQRPTAGCAKRMMNDVRRKGTSFIDRGRWGAGEATPLPGRAAQTNAYCEQLRTTL